MMNGLSNTDLTYNLRVNQTLLNPNQLLVTKEAKDGDNTTVPQQNIIKLTDPLKEEPNTKYIYLKRQSKTGICATCGCCVKSKILSCSLCQVSKCKFCVEKESNAKSNPKKGVKKYFYICQSCHSEKKMRKHDMPVHYEKETTEFLRKKHKNTPHDLEQIDNDNSEDDSFQNESASVTAAAANKKRKLSSVSMTKKKKGKILPEKIFNLIEKKSMNYYSEETKDEMCIECNAKCSPIDKVKPFSSIEQLLYYLQYFFTDYQSPLINEPRKEEDDEGYEEEDKAKPVDYASIIVSAIMKEKSQKSFIAECNFILCQKCLYSLKENIAPAFTIAIDQLIQKIHLLNQKKVLEDNIFSAPGIYSKLSIIITQFLIVQGFSFYQSQFIQCLFSKIKSINEKLYQSEYNNSNILQLMVSSNAVSDNQNGLKTIKENHHKSKKSIKELDELFSKFQDGSKEIFTSFSLKNNDLDQIMKMLNNCFSILGESQDGISPKDSNNLNVSKVFIESLIKKFKTIVSNNLGNNSSRSPEEKELGGTLHNDNESISINSKENNASQESWPFSMKINELYPLMFNMAQQPAMPNNTLEMLLKSYQMSTNNTGNINPIKNTNNNSISNLNHPGNICKSAGINSERPQIQKPIENFNVLLNNVPNFTLSLNNYTNSVHPFTNPPLQFNPNINQQNRFQYQTQPYHEQMQLLQQQQQLLIQQQLNQMSNNPYAYQHFTPMNPYNMNQR